MAGQRIDVMELRQLIQLKQKEQSNRSIADALGVSRNTVNNYVNTFKQHGFSYAELLQLSDNDLSELFPQPDYKDNNRYSVLATYFQYFADELHKPGCTLQTLWNEYLGKHPQGYRYTQFVMHYQGWKGKVKASGILEHKAGQKLFVDFTGKKLSYIDRASGKPQNTEVFVAILPCSQYTYVCAVNSQKREDFIQCMNNCLRWLGGVPRAIVSDNLKSAVSKGHKYAPTINKTMKGFAIHYGCVVDPARPYHPQDKALVESAVRLVYQRIFYALSKYTFFSLSELNKAISELLVTYNDYSFQNMKTTRKERFLEIEKTYLESLPQEAYYMRQYRRAKVQKIGHIFVSENRNYYSVPHRYIGHYVEVQYNQEVVEIFYNHQRIASHPRSCRGGHYVTIQDHMPSSHQAYNSWNPEYFEKRAKKIGEFTCQYIIRLIEQYDYPEVGYKQAQGILAFVKSYPPERVEKACKRGMDHHTSGYKIIENILESNIDQDEGVGLFRHSAPKIPPHSNIRGADHYK